MNKNNKPFNLFFVIMLGMILFMVWYTSTKAVTNSYTLGGFKSDLAAGSIAEVVIEPNAEVPTGVISIELKNGERRELNVTDVK